MFKQWPQNLIETPQEWGMRVLYGTVEEVKAKANRVHPRIDHVADAADDTVWANDLRGFELVESSSCNQFGVYKHDSLYNLFVYAENVKEYVLLGEGLGLYATVGDALASASSEMVESEFSRKGICG